MGTGAVESRKYHQSIIKAAHVTFVIHSKSSEDTQLFCVSRFEFLPKNLLIHCSAVVPIHFHST